MQIYFKLNFFSNFIDDFDIGQSLVTFKSDYFKAIIMRFTRMRSKKKNKFVKKAHYCVEISDARASREAEWPIATRPRFIGPQASIMQAGEHPKEPDTAPVL